MRRLHLPKIGALLDGAALSFTATLAAAAHINCGTTPIRLAFYEYGNFFFDADKPSPKGIDKDVVDELIKRSGCKFQTQVMARARIWADLASGALDMGVSGIQNPDRDQFAWFAHYAKTKNYVLLNNEAAKFIQSGDEFLALKSLKFGAVRSFKHGTQQDQLLDQLRAQQRVEDSVDAEAVFRKLKDHRIDAMFSEPAVYRKMLQTLDMQGSVTVQDWTPGEKGVSAGLILAKQRFSEADAAQWRDVIEAMRKDGTLKGIYARYLPEPEANRLLER